MQNVVSKIKITHCIKVYKCYDNPIMYQTNCVSIGILEHMLQYTIEEKDLKTIAIFKIKIKNVNATW